MHAKMDLLLPKSEVRISFEYAEDTKDEIISSFREPFFSFTSNIFVL